MQILVQSICSVASPVGCWQSPTPWHHLRVPVGLGRGVPGVCGTPGVHLPARNGRSPNRGLVAAKTAGPIVTVT